MYEHTRDQGHSVLATILGRLEDVRLNTGEGWAQKVSEPIQERVMSRSIGGVHLAGTERPREEAAEALRSRV
jgi:hypothetical protein